MFVTQNHTEESLSFSTFLLKKYEFFGMYPELYFGIQQCTHAGLLRYTSCSSLAATHNFSRPKMRGGIAAATTTTHQSRERRRGARDLLYCDYDKLHYTTLDPQIRLYEYCGGALGRGVVFWRSRFFFFRSFFQVLLSALEMVKEGRIG